MSDLVTIFQILEILIWPVSIIFGYIIIASAINLVLGIVWEFRHRKDKDNGVSVHR